MNIHAEIIAEAKENICIVHLKGEIDVSYLPDFENVVKPLLDNAYYQAFILDCENLLFIDSKIVGYIAYLYTTLSKTSRKLFIADTNETINDILTLVGLKSVIPYYDSVEETLKNILIPTAK